jgi:hypothetical protein
MVMEYRTKELNARDVKTVVGSRFDLPKGAAFRVSHEIGAREPLCWAADIVAGAVRIYRQSGDSGCRDLLADSLYEIDVEAG